MHTCAFDSDIIFRDSSSISSHIDTNNIGSLPNVTVVGFHISKGSILPSNVVINCCIALTLLVFL